jgi:hypothetical protein
LVSQPANQPEHKVQIKNISRIPNGKVIPLFRSTCQGHPRRQDSNTKSGLASEVNTFPQSFCLLHTMTPGKDWQHSLLWAYMDVQGLIQCTRPSPTDPSSQPATLQPSLGKEATQGPRLNGDEWAVTAQPTPTRNITYCPEDCIGHDNVCLSEWN